MGTPHKHAALIKAWAEGAQIQSRYGEPWEWHDNDKPIWNELYQYRVKPESKPDIIREYCWYLHEDGTLMRTIFPPSNVRFVFDGDTKELKSVEIIKHE